MKRFFYFLFCLCLLFSVCSCGESSEPEETPVEKTFSFLVSGTEIRPGDDITEIQEHIGKELSYFEAPSCAFQGLDKTYTYSGFTITTSPINGKDTIVSILLTEDIYTTQEGVYVGCSVNDVEKTYGQPTNGSYVYTNGCKLIFVIRDEKVISIEYVDSEE